MRPCGETGTGVVVIGDTVTGFTIGACLHMRLGGGQSLQKAIEEALVQPF